MSGPKNWLDARSRVTGWRQEMSEAGLAAPPLISGGWDPVHGYDVARELVREGLPTAIFAAYDLMALGMMRAATLSGVQVKKVTFWIFINMGVLSAVADIVYSSRSNGAQPGAGNMFELDAIAAAFVGGAAVTDGIGTVTGAMVGGLIMAVMSNGMQLMGVDQSVQSMVRGLVLLLAVAFDVYNKRRAAGTR